MGLLHIAGFEIFWHDAGAGKGLPDVRIALVLLLVATLAVTAGACDDGRHLGPPFAQVIPECSEAVQAPKRWFETTTVGSAYEEEGMVEKAERACKGPDSKTWMMVMTFRLEGDAIAYMADTRDFYCGVKPSEFFPDFHGYQEELEPFPHPVDDAWACSHWGYDVTDNVRDDGSVPDLDEWDGSKGVSVAFRVDNNVAEFEAENIGPVYLQRGLWMWLVDAEEPSLDVLHDLAVETLNRWPETTTVGS